MNKSTYKLTRTGEGMLLSLRGSDHRFILTDDAVVDSLVKGRLRVRYVVPGDAPTHGVCILSGLDVTRAADCWMNGEFDHAVMILMPLMVDSVRFSLGATEKFLAKWRRSHLDQSYKYHLN